MRSRKTVGLVSLLVAAACSSAPETSKVHIPQGTLEARAATVTAAVSDDAGTWGPLLDLGSTDPAQVVTVSIVFQVKHRDALEELVRATEDPASLLHQTFLTVPEFVSLFAPTKADIARVSSYLTTFGITPGAVLADQLVLKATGTVSAFTQAFTFTMNDFRDASGNVFHRPTSLPTIPHDLADVMLVVTGFSSQPSFVSRLKSASAIPGFRGKTLPPKGSSTTSSPGNYAVGDFANQYDVNPLYQRGIDGTGLTIGIATLNGFNPVDAYTYWSAAGLTVNPNRVTQIFLDDAAPPAPNNGSGETTLDVQQSGGIAPGANIIVYDAPNTDGGFLDVFYAATSDNLVDDISTSWGGSETYYVAATNGGVDFTAEMAAFHQAFLESAAQGISVFVAQGDAGAFDSEGTAWWNVLSVDTPGSDPAVTSAGGTTTPATISGDLFGGSPSVSVTIAQEQVWGWDWLQTFLNANDVGDSSTWNEFPSGGGGGVSITFPRPYYQEGVAGMRDTQPDQVLTQPGVPNYTLPAGFAGRNVPDIAADADPLTGYLMYTTQTGWFGFVGGTSFVAPQLNGVAALVRQRVGHRVGLWNPMLYRLARHHDEHHAKPIVDITAGDNWFYDGVAGYDPASGLGVLDVTAFADAVARE